MTRPLVDPQRKPRLWRRTFAWCRDHVEAPPAYEPRACEPGDARILHLAIAGLVAALIIIAYALRGCLA